MSAAATSEIDTGSAALLVCLAEYWRAADLSRSLAPYPEREDDYGDACHKMFDTVRELCDIPAATAGGIRAKASALRHYMHAISMEQNPDPEIQCCLSLLEDISGAVGEFRAGLPDDRGSYLGLSRREAQG